MLGVLLQSLFHFPAALADLYFSGVLEDGNADPDSESDDDEGHSFAQVRVDLLSANSTELSGSTRSGDPSPIPVLPGRKMCVRVCVCVLHNFPLVVLFSRTTTSPAR